MGTSQHLRIEQDGPVTVAFLVDSLLIDRSMVLELSDELLQFIDAERPQRLLLSFRDVTRFGTESINVLLRARNAVAAYGGQIRLCAMPNGIREAFKILRLDGTVFPIHESTADALATFA